MQHVPALEIPVHLAFGDRMGFLLQAAQGLDLILHVVQKFWGTELPAALGPAQMCAPCAGTECHMLSKPWSHHVLCVAHRLDTVHRKPVPLWPT